MDVQQMRYVLEVARTGSVRAAAGQTAELRLAWAHGLADVLRDLLRLVVADSPEHPVRVIAMGCADQRTALAHPRRSPARPVLTLVMFGVCPDVPIASR